MTLVARHEAIALLDVAVQPHLLVVEPAEITLESANETVTMIVAAIAETESVLAPLRIATVISRTATVTENVTGTATAIESEEMDVIVSMMMVAMELLMMAMIAVSDTFVPSFFLGADQVRAQRCSSA